MLIVAGDERAQSLARLLTIGDDGDRTPSASGLQKISRKTRQSWGELSLATTEIINANS